MVSCGPPRILWWEDRRAQHEGALVAPKSKVELFAAIRRDSRTESLSVRALARKYDVHRRMVRKAHRCGHG